MTDDKGRVETLVNESKTLAKGVNDWSERVQEAGLEVVVETEGKSGAHRIVLHIDRKERLV